MLDHRVKQNQFARHAEYFVCGEVLARRIWSGELEGQKHRALYVGLPTSKRVINLQGRISAPSSLRREDARSQIAMVNDFIVTFPAGVAYETMTTDLPAMEAMLT